MMLLGEDTVMTPWHTPMLLFSKMPCFVALQLADECKIIAAGVALKHLFLF
jgi:hypothetical protein